MKRSLVIAVCTCLAALLFLGGARPPRAEAFRFVGHAFPVGQWSFTAIATGDFNADGKLDVATTTYGDAVSVLLGNGNGTLSAGTDYATGTAPKSLAVADFDTDGKLDLATANQGGDSFSVLLGDGSGGFGAKSDYDTGELPDSLAVGDFNGDGKVDVATGSATWSLVSLRLGNAGGGFDAIVDYDVDQPSFLAACNLNVDAPQDLVVASNRGDGVAALLGDGTGDFQYDGLLYPADHNPTSLALGDFNRDGKRDVVVTNLPSLKVTVLLGDGNGAFGAGRSYPTAGLPGSVGVADFNGDGRQDLVTAESDATVSLLRNRGGSFAAPANIGTASRSEYVAVGDFNGDGKPDIATANDNGGVSVLRNTTKPTIAALKPTRGRVGTTVTIVGSQAGWSFGASRSTSKVYFGTKAVTKYVSWSKYKIIVRVPWMSKGRKAVTVRTSFGKSNVKYFTLL